MEGLEHLLGCRGELRDVYGVYYFEFDGVWGDGNGVLGGCWWMGMGTFFSRL